MNLHRQTFQSPIGSLHLFGNETRLFGVLFDRNLPLFLPSFGQASMATTFILEKTKEQLAEYFSGVRQSFDLALHLDGTDFQKLVWSSLAKIPYGETRTYQEQAAIIGRPRAARAVGRADGLNPLCIVLPCHRVLGSNGKLTGYAGGEEKKSFLLSLEGVERQANGAFKKAKH